MRSAIQLATIVLFFSATVWSQQSTDSKTSTSTSYPCATAPNETERTACWQDLARKAKAYLAGDPCPDTTTDMERTNCWLDIATKTKARLAANYQKIQKAIKTHMLQQPSNFRASDERALAGLKTAQLAWTRYRDSQCGAAEQRYEGGTIAPSIRAGCERDLAERRMEELHQTYAMYLVTP